MNMTALLRDVPVRRKLLYLVAWSLAAATLFAVLAAAVEQWFVARGELQADLVAHARLLGANAGSPLLFGDQEEAQHTLQALETIEDVEFAEVLDASGRPFATYLRAGAARPAFHHMINGEQFFFSPTHIEVGLPIVVQDEQVGSIHVLSNLRPLYKKMALSVASLLAAMLGGLAVAAMLVARLHPVITRPIAELVGLMERVSDEKNYSLRAEFRRKDELGKLGSEFNEMLTQIQARDDALERYGEHLEQEVAHRTARLTEAQRIAHFGNGEWDVVNNTLSWSDEIYRIFGLTPQQLGFTLEAFLQAVHPDDRARVEGCVRGALEQGNPYSLDHRILLPDGSVRYVHEEAEVIRGADGQPLKMLGTVQDVTEARLAEESLRKANAELGLFRLLLDKSSDGIYVIEPATMRFLDVNEQACRDLGYSRAEVLSMSVSDIDTVFDEEAWKQVMEPLRQSGTIRFESMHRRKDGSTHPVEISSGYVQLDKPYILTTVRDIAERKQAEEALRKANVELRLFRDLMDNSTDGIEVMDPDTFRFLDVSEKECLDLGYTREELLGMSVFDIDPAVDEKSTARVKEQARKSGSVRFESVHRRKDGTTYPVELNVRLVELDRAYMLGMVRDITERRRAEEQLRESEARYRGIFEYADDIIYLLEPDGRFRSLSPAFERITGWKVEEWLGKPFAPIIHPEDLSYANEVFQRALAGESMPSFRLRIARKSGEYFDADLNITPLGREAATGALGIARDVTERSRMEEEIRKLNEELEIKVQERTRQLVSAQEELVRKEKLAVLGQVAGSVGHELRNPLGVMNNAVYFLQTVLADADETTKEYLNIIRDEIAGSERIVSDLLDSVRTKPPHPETVGVAEIIGQTLAKLSIPSGVTVQLDIPAALPPLRVDAMQIHQVFRNLISNGVEAMPQGGTLEIRAVENAAAKNITVSVGDTGVGMTQEQMEKIFQPLFTTKARGIGLGLVVVKNLTEANGGNIDVKSEVGKGTQFSITLPITDERESEHA